MTEPVDTPQPHAISDMALDQIFRHARTHRHWLPGSIPLETLREVYALARLGPTTSNSCPARFVFLITAAAKERLRPSLSPTNVGKTMTAPVSVIVASDTEFYEQFETLWPRGDPRSQFVGNQPLIQETILRNGSLEGGYFIIAARSLGLDCGPMSGFDAEKVNAEFFPDGKWKANFLLNLGYGDPSKLRPRDPRLEFEEACRVL
jgi:3-hydroxypropanoate dehydrogenase